MARFQANPKEYHYATVKRIFRYLKETSDHGIWYDRNSDFTLCTYTNADWAGDRDDSNSTSGGAFFLGIVDCSEQRRYLYFSNQVFKRFTKNIWFKKL